jgi:hypothetical protein
MQTAPGQHIDLTVEQFFEILTKPYDVQQRTVRVHVDQQVHIAIATVVATCDRTEHSEIARTVLRRYLEDVVTFLPQIHVVVAILIVDAQVRREVIRREAVHGIVRMATISWVMRYWSSLANGDSWRREGMTRCTRRTHVAA